MFYHDGKLKYIVRVDRPDPAFAKLLQQAINGGTSTTLASICRISSEPHYAEADSEGAPQKEPMFVSFPLLDGHNEKIKAYDPSISLVLNHTDKILQLMKMLPIWDLHTLNYSYPSLDSGIEVDVAIIGGGITGITTAQCLKDRGFTVAVLDAHQIGKGTSGRSTGNLYTVTEYPLQKLHNIYDVSVVKQVVASRQKALDFITNNIQQWNIDCDFHPRSMFLFQTDGSINIEKENELAKEAGLTVSPIQAADIPFPFENGMIFKDFAQFNPLRYVQAVAHRIHSEDCRIYEHTRVLDIEESNEGVLLKTTWAEVRANYVVHATHTPMGLQVPYHTTLGPYREYGVAVKLKKDHYPEGIYWGHYGQKKYSIRSYWVDNEPYLIGVGSMHKVGQSKDNQAQIEELLNFVRQHFEVATITHKWGGQNYKPADFLPYIGRKKTDSNQFIATGFSTDGLIYGTLSAIIITDTLSGTPNIYANLYKASRHQPLKAAKRTFNENLNVAGQILQDYTISGLTNSLKDLKEGEGAIIQKGIEKLAVHKDHQGHLTALSPICPHMGCIVHWNNAEKSWDCPCHGSRFDCSGTVIEGPAFRGLETRSLKKDQ